MNILVVNDDGIRSPGIRALCDVLTGIADVFVFAPEQEKSASGSAMTLNNDIIVRKYREFPVKVKKAFVLENGFPVDCAKTGLYILEKKYDIRVDLIVSGINRGENTGIDLRYSGTVGAAFDGMEKKIPSIAVSLASYDEKNERFRDAAEFTGVFIGKYYQKIKDSRFSDYLFNINYPDCDNVTEFEFTRPAEFFYDEYYDMEENADFMKVRLKGKRIFEKHTNKGTDLFAVEHGKVSISLLKPEYIYEIPNEF